MSDSHTIPPPMDAKSTNKVSGVVKFYSVQKCYGFIKRDDTNEFVFVHSKSITGKNQRRVTRSLAKGEHVEFDVIMSDRSPEAINVTGINGDLVVGSEYGLISMQWHQYNAYKAELLRNGEDDLRGQSPRARRFFHRRRNVRNHSGNRGHNQHQHNNQKAAINQQRSANEQRQNQNINTDENRPKTRRRRYNRNRRTRRRNNDDNDGTVETQDQETVALEMTESNITTLLSELNIDTKNVISGHSTSSESLDFEKIHNDESNPIPCVTSLPNASATSRLAATFNKGNQ